MKKPQPPALHQFALLSAIALDDAAAVQLLPAGEFKSRDGRPGPGKFWRISDEQGVKLAAKMERTAQLSAFNFDYEHQTLHALKNGQPAPASGWATQFEWRAGKGLYALNVDWTARARGHIDAKEYLFISPLIEYDEAGNVTGVLNAALVNTPALLGMDALVASLQADMVASLFIKHTPEPNMNLLQLLIAAFSLKADATEADAMAALSALQARVAEKPVVPPQLAAALSIKTDADVDVAVTAVAALQAQGKTAEQTTIDTIKALQTQVAALSAQQTAGTVASVIEKAIADGKLIPAMQGWATDLGNKDLAALQAYVKDAPVMAISGQQSGGKDPGDGGGSAALSAVQADVIARMGLTAEQFTKAA